MKKPALIAAFILFAGTAFADPVEGMWQTRTDDNGHFGHIEIKPCGPAFCGTLVKAFDKAGKQVESPSVGKKIIWDMMAQGDGYYADGKVWSPDRDKTYNSKMQLTADSLAIKGCVFGMCRDGGQWKRLK